jgi:hypothetical protein
VRRDEEIERGHIFIRDLVVGRRASSTEQRKRGQAKNGPKSEGGCDWSRGGGLDAVPISMPFPSQLDFTPHTLLFYTPHLSPPSHLPPPEYPYLLPIYRPSSLLHPPHGFPRHRNTSTRKGHLSAIQVSISPMWSCLQQTRTPGMCSPLYAVPRGIGHRHHVTCRHLPRLLAIQQLLTSLSLPS